MRGPKRVAFRQLFGSKFRQMELVNLGNGHPMDTVQKVRIHNFDLEFRIITL